MRRRKCYKFPINTSELTRQYTARDFTQFAIKIDPTIELTPFHKTFYKVLNEFAHRRINRLMISIPPQHGKSYATSRLLPSYLLGLNPDLRIAIGSYSFNLARKFGQGVRQTIESEQYTQIFPCTYLKGQRGTLRSDSALLTAEEFDCVGKKGGMKMVGRECSLTGNRVDVMILDDLYKDALEANSPTVRDNTWDWYTSVVRTRLHNDSQEIIVFTRWHEDDLIGRLMNHEQVVEVASLDDLKNVPPRAWVRLNFEALKATESTPLDDRAPGEPLWPSRHSGELLLERRAIDPEVFESLYQGNPQSAKGFLYSAFDLYARLPDRITSPANYTDTADTGSDYLCSVCYTTADDSIYILDVEYSSEPMEVTEKLVANMLVRNKITLATIESNNGGRGFSRSVERLTKEQNHRIVINAFHQSHSKEARILTNATAVNRRVVMPQDWQIRWPEFANDLTTFRRLFRANAHDDAPDALTGIVELENNRTSKNIKTLHFSNL